MSASRNCEICAESESKYKCPICLIKYCSVACFRLHKEQAGCVKKVDNQQTSISSENEQQTECQFQTEDTVKTEKLELLGENNSILNFLKNRHLRDIIRSLNSSTDPSRAMAEAMSEPIFIDFATKCLQIVDSL